MSTFGDIERTVADLYEYRWAMLAGILVITAAILGFAYWKGLHRWMWQRRLPVAIVSAPPLAVMIWLGWSLGSPLFTNVTVDEAFPFAQNAVVPGGMEREEVEEIMAGIAKVGNTVSQDMPSAGGISAAVALMGDDGSGEIVVITGDDMAMLQDGLEMVTAAQPAPGSGGAVDPVMAAKGADMIQKAVKNTAPAQTAEPAVVKLKEGDFKDADSFHRGSGQATIYRSPDGSNLLRLENLDVTNGPALHVYLSPHEDPKTTREVRTDGVDLGGLKGNRGNQNYPIPSDVDAGVYNSVVIYCQPFNVIFSVATLREAG